MKKIIALLTAAVMLFTFAACKGEEKPEEITTTQPALQTEETTSAVQSTEQTTYEEESSTETETTTEMQQEVTLSANPSEWSDEEVVAFYKAAAAKSSNAKSVQTMKMTELVVNDGDGLLGTLVEMITPFFVKALEKNSTEFDGITGGYQNLMVADTTSVKAYKSNGKTVVEMTLKEQTDGAHGDQFSGTVGHAITVLGDVAVVQQELPQFRIGLDEADIVLRYTNPKLKVLINENGVIEKGEWSYTIKVRIANLRVDAVKVPIGATVDKGHGSVSYRVVVGGGF